MLLGWQFERYHIPRKPGEREYMCEMRLWVRYIQRQKLFIQTISNPLSFLSPYHHHYNPLSLSLSRPPANLVHSLDLLALHNPIRLPLAQLLRAVVVVGVQRRIEEVAHIRHDSACSAQLSQGAGAGAAERGRKGAGFDELVVLVGLG
jgi:hypothetical protein